MVNPNRQKLCSRIENASYDAINCLSQVLAEDATGFSFVEAMQIGRQVLATQNKLMDLHRNILKDYSGQE